MRVAFNARLLHAPDLRGWNRYTVNLLAELPALGVVPVLCTDRPLHPGHLARLPEGSYLVRQSPPMRYPAWEQWWLPRQCARDRVDVLHSPFNFGLPWSSPCPRVLTLHDAIDTVYDRYGRREGRRRAWSRTALLGRLYLWQARVRAHRIITVSAHARGDLIAALGVPAARIAVIPEAADPRFTLPVAPEARAAARRRFNLSRPFLFYVGGWEARKNVPFLVRAFAAAGLDGVDLVLAGGREAQRAELSALARALGVADRARLLGWVDDEDLPALYAEALAFVYPSVYEGFGLQLCESMALGCPTLAARATSLPEVVGDGGDLFDPSRPDDLATLLRRLASEPAYRDDLARRARARSTDFAWSKTAEATVSVYHDLLSGTNRAMPCASVTRS